MNARAKRREIFLQFCAKFVVLVTTNLVVLFKLVVCQRQSFFKKNFQHYNYFDDLFKKLYKISLKNNSFLKINNLLFVSRSCFLFERSAQIKNSEIKRIIYAV